MNYVLIKGLIGNLSQVLYRIVPQKNFAKVIENTSDSVSLHIDACYFT